MSVDVHTPVGIKCEKPRNLPPVPGLQRVDNRYTPSRTIYDGLGYRWSRLEAPLTHLAIALLFPQHSIHAERYPCTYNRTYDGHIAIQLTRSCTPNAALGRSKDLASGCVPSTAVPPRSQQRRRTGDSGNMTHPVLRSVLYATPVHVLSD